MSKLKFDKEKYRWMEIIDDVPLFYLNEREILGLILYELKRKRK